ncbi:MAG: hypothetical protein MUE81_15550 [Thermoflexibacter sp.]|nr:hypothetical protein [Thermoflexibacter sp.]
MNIGELIKLAIGVVIGVFGLFAMLGTIINTEKDTISTTIGLFIFSGIMAGGGFWLVRSAMLSSKKRKDNSLENTVLRVAALNQGRLTVAQLALHANITTQAAENMLNTMQERGFAHISVSEEGAIIYEFTGLLKS